MLFPVRLLNAFLEWEKDNKIKSIQFTKFCEVFLFVCLPTRLVLRMWKVEGKKALRTETKKVEENLEYNEYSYLYTPIPSI